MKSSSSMWGWGAEEMGGCPLWEAQGPAHPLETSTPCDLVGHGVVFTQASPQIFNSWEWGRTCSEGQADLDLGHHSSRIAAEVEIPEIEKGRLPWKPDVEIDFLRCSCGWWELQKHFPGCGEYPGSFGSSISTDSNCGAGEHLEPPKSQTEGGRNILVEQQQLFLEGAAQKIKLLWQECQRLEWGCKTLLL